MPIFDAVFGFAVLPGFAELFALVAVIGFGLVEVTEEGLFV